MNFSEAQADTPNDILRWRRDVRHFRADPIPEPVLDRLSAAMDLGIQTTGAQCTDMAGMPPEPASPATPAVAARPTMH